MTINGASIIIADDLTGANDTSLQYFRSGKKTKIIIDPEQDFVSDNETQVWAYSTESRNIDKEDAYIKVKDICGYLHNRLGIDNYYKKIDSTLRGNVGIEIAAILGAVKKDAAIVCPAYIEENRVTIGAYQLLNGLPIERTQCALDPKAPIYESYIPDILKKKLNDVNLNIGTIGLNVVSKGAAPIINKIKELIENGKNVIITDAMSNTDIEQIALAINKCGFNILPCGSAGLATALNKISNEKEKAEIVFNKNTSKLIISGSATQLSANQILKLKEEKKNIYCIDLSTQDIISGADETLIHAISQKLIQGVDVLIHSSEINKELISGEAENILIDAGIAKNEFAGKITDYLADLAHEINLLSDFILITIGGETSYKCAKSINSKYLEILDDIKPAIPLCRDINNKIIVTKSGNFGTNSTLVDIVNYFDAEKY